VRDTEERVDELGPRGEDGDIRPGLQLILMKKAFDHCVSIDFGFQNCLLAQNLHMYMLI
jgi:hypothetical protein